MIINSFRNQYFFLSNFSDSDFVYDGLLYHNAEAAFQSAKCIKNPERQKFTELNATQAKKLGRGISLRPDWENIKVKVMRDVVNAKFEQNPELAEKLLNTEDAYLEEGNTWGDRTWGTVNGSGANLLGHILMETREKIRETTNGR